MDRQGAIGLEDNVHASDLIVGNARGHLPLSGVYAEGAGGIGIKNGVRGGGGDQSSASGRSDSHGVAVQADDASEILDKIELAGGQIGIRATERERDEYVDIVEVHDVIAAGEVFNVNPFYHINTA